jgi:hypothetical protein
MELTKISNENIDKIFQNEECKKEIVKKFNNYYFMKLIYTLLDRATSSKINMEIYHNINEEISLDLSEFIPIHIKDYIIKQKYIYHKIIIEIGDKTFTIYVCTEKKINIKKIAYYLKIILYLCCVHSTHKETNFTFKLFLTDFSKIEPIIEVEPTHINSGYTINHKTIIIFRKEELYKVFIHECFHLFCLDFSNIKDINYVEMFEPLFKIKSNFLLFESFCEYWSRTINSAIVAYHTKLNITFKEFEISFQLNINVERCFSLLQMNHFLKSMKLSYEEIIEGKAIDKYREKTNGLCYYVLTGLLMYHFEQTMYWFIDNNETILNFTKDNKSIYLFFHFIKLIYNKKDLLEFLQRLNTIPIKNMYMSAFEIELFS